MPLKHFFFLSLLNCKSLEIRVFCMRFWLLRTYDSWEEYRNVLRTCRDSTREAKAHLELKLARDVKNNKKGFFNYISSKRKARDNVGPLLNEAGVLVTEDTEKADLLTVFFASVFSVKVGLQESQALEVREEACRKHDLRLVEEDCVRDHLSNLDTHNSMGPDHSHECWGSWQMSLLSHSPSSLTGRGGQEKCPRTGEGQMSLQSSKRARRRIQGTTGRSASPSPLERWSSEPFWRPSSSKWRKRRLSGVVSMDSLRGNHAWPIWWLSTMVWLAG